MASWLLRLGAARALRLSLAFGGVAAVVLAPWVAHNVARYGPSILIENQGPYNLWVANSPEPPDEIVIKLIEKHIKRHPDANGFIFKGFPRTLVQAYILDGLLRKINSRVSFVMDIRVPTLELIKRLDARGKTDRQMSYDLETTTIVHRLEQHEKICQPLVGYYEKQREVAVIEGQGTTREVWERIAGPAEEAWRKAR